MPNRTVEEIDREYYARPLRPAAPAATTPRETEADKLAARSRQRRLDEWLALNDQADSLLARGEENNDPRLVAEGLFTQNRADQVGTSLGIQPAAGEVAGEVSEDTSFEQARRRFVQQGFGGATDRVGGETSEISQRPVSVRGVVEGAADLAREYPVATTVGGIAAARRVLPGLGQIRPTFTTIPTVARLAAASPRLAALAPRLGRAFTPLGLAAIEGEALYRLLPAAVGTMEDVQGKPRGSTSEAYLRAIDSLIGPGGAGIGRLMGGGR